MIHKVSDLCKKIESLFQNLIGKSNRRIQKSFLKEINDNIIRVIKLDENKRRIFGLERLDVSKKIYITEGPIDSLFLPNAIAVAGSDLEVETLKRNAVYVFDNEVYVLGNVLSRV